MKVVMKDGEQQVQTPEYVPAGPVRLAPRKRVDLKLKPTDHGERIGEKPATIPAIVYYPPKKRS